MPRVEPLNASKTTCAEQNTAWRWVSWFGHKQTRPVYGRGFLRDERASVVCELNVWVEKRDVRKMDVETAPGVLCTSAPCKRGARGRGDGLGNGDAASYVLPGVDVLNLAMVGASRVHVDPSV